MKYYYPYIRARMIHMKLMYSLSALPSRHNCTIQTEFHKIFELGKTLIQYNTYTDDKGYSDTKGYSKDKEAFPHNNRLNVKMELEFMTNE